MLSVAATLEEAALSLEEAADELALDDAVPPHATSANDKDTDVAKAAIFPIVFMLSLSVCRTPLAHPKESFIEKIYHRSLRLYPAISVTARHDARNI